MQHNRIIPGYEVFTNSNAYSCSLFSAVPEAETSRAFGAGRLIKPEGELSGPTSQTCWHEDGISRGPKLEISANSEGKKRTLVMKSPMPSLLALSSCKPDIESEFNEIFEEVKGEKLLLQGTCHHHRILY